MLTQVHRYALPLLLASPLLTAAIDLDLDKESSVKNAAKTISKDLMSYYTGYELGQPKGLFSDDSYWGTAGAVWASLIDYWAYTGDDQYNDIIQQALLFQRGSEDDFMPANQTKSLGNDDESTWALAAMTAAERQFPSKVGSPTWLDLAKTVFDKQVARWDTETCSGGLRWQIFAFNNGYDYKNSQSNGNLFQLAARLAAFTGNQTYSDWAEKTYQWTKSVGIISDEFRVYDGAPTEEDCSDVNKIQWSYNAASFVYGSAVMYNHTTNSSWKATTKSLLNATNVFFKDGVMMEVACEPHGTCSKDQLSFKGIAAQWLGATLRVAPYTSDFISARLRSSAAAAARQCTGGNNGTACGERWTTSTSNGSTGLGQELSAMNVVLASLAEKSARPANATSTNATTTESSGSGQRSSPRSTDGPSPTQFTSSSTSLDYLMAGNIILCSVLAAASCMFIL